MLHGASQAVIFPVELSVTALKPPIHSWHWLEAVQKSHPTMLHVISPIATQDDSPLTAYPLEHIAQRA